MSRLLPFLAILLCSLSLGACGDAPAAGDCEKMLSHFIDLKVAGAAEADRPAFAENLRTELGTGYLERCERNIKGSQIKCSLKASTKAEFEACDK